MHKPFPFSSESSLTRVGRLHGNLLSTVAGDGNTAPQGLFQSAALRLLSCCGLDIVLPEVSFGPLLEVTKTQLGCRNTANGILLLPTPPAHLGH